MNTEQSRFAMIPLWIRGACYNDESMNALVKSWIQTDKTIAELHEGIAVRMYELKNYWMFTAKDLFERNPHPPIVVQPKKKWTVQTWTRYKLSKGGFEHVPCWDTRFESREDAEKYVDAKERKELLRNTDHWTEYRIVEETK